MIRGEASTARKLRRSRTDSYEEFFRSAQFPQVKLEVLTRNSFRLINYVLGVGWSFALATTIFIVVSTENLASRSNANAVLLVIGVSATIALSVFIFLLIAFPQRIVREILKDKAVFPHQIMLVSLLVFLVLISDFGLIGLIDFWNEYSLFRSREPEKLDRFFREFAALTQLESNTATCFTVLMAIFFWGCMLQVSGFFSLGVKERLDYIAHRKRPSSTKTGIAIVVEQAEGVAEELEQELEENSDDAALEKMKEEQELNKRPIARMAKNLRENFQRRLEDLKVASNSVGICSAYYFCCCCLCCSFEKCTDKSSLRAIIRRGIAWTLFLKLLIYWILFASLSNELDFRPSVIPFVGMLTVLRVCSEKDENGTSFCNLNEYRYGFQRALAMTFLFLFDVYVFWSISSIARKVYVQLRTVPYALNRANFLSYSFVHFHTWLFWILVFFISILDLSISSVDSFIQQVVLNETALDQGVTNTSALFYVQTSPLYIAGVSPDSPSFTGILILLSCWTFILTYSQLPSDAHGCLGWFRGSLPGRTEKNKDGRTMEHSDSMQEMLERFFDEQPIIMSHEGGIHRAVRDSGPCLLRKSTRDLLVEEDAALATKQQLKSHVLVIDTEAEMFNFAAITYKIKPGMSETKKAALIENDDFALLQHIVSEKFDTHILVAESSDRVIVAFRGTASRVNVDTDLDLAFVPHVSASSTRPIISDERNPVERIAVESEPRVHQGFQIAFNEVKDRLHELIDPILWNGESPKQQKALFCTGHSLGGALALLCAFDFAQTAKMNDPESQPSVGCSTFGCPRVGNYSFVQRFKRMVPSCRRWVLASDIIPKTPPRIWKGAFQGYHHCGLELLLDLNGNLLLSPTRLERSFLHGFKRIKKTMHFCSRYCLGIVLWTARLNMEPPIWTRHINDMVRVAKADLIKREMLLVDAEIFLKEGVIHNEKRNAATQTNDFPSQDQEISLPEETGEEEGFSTEIDESVEDEPTEHANAESFIKRIDAAISRGTAENFTLEELEALKNLLNHNIEIA